MREFLVENFDSIEHLILANERPLNPVFAGRPELESNGSDYAGFYKTKTYEEAVDLLRYGYDAPLEQIKKGIQANVSGSVPSKTSVKVDIVGYAPHVPNAVIGIPQSMINTATIAKKAKIVSIVYDSTNAGCTSAEDYIKAGVAVLSVISSLELAGYRVALKVLFKSAEANCQTIVSALKVKDWRQPLDLKKIAFPICHPSMHRRIGFRGTETIPGLTDRSMGGDYGTNLSAKYRSDPKKLISLLVENRVISDKEVFINIPMCQSNRFDPVRLTEACGLGKE